MSTIVSSEPGRNRSADRRRLPIGAEVLPAGGVHFRVWAPDRKKVAVVLDGPTGSRSPATLELDAEPDGYFSGLAIDAEPGSLYRFRLDQDRQLYPDPASRFQPDGPFGPSQVIDPAAFRWTDEDWPGVRREGQVLYEVHIGTWTEPGTWAAAQDSLAELAEMGITLLEVLPVAEFPGRFGWGYDGVNLFAPFHHYGSPDHMRAFVAEAHRAGLGVILDVVYHYGAAVGDFLGQFAKDYYTDRYPNEWGSARNFDGPNSHGVRQFVLTNIRYWIEEFHLDGFRVDATQAYFDQSPEPILAAIPRVARQSAGRRTVLIVAESEPQQARLIRPVEDGGYGMDAAWNDDFHHAAIARLTGLTEAYYRDYRGTPEEFIASAKWGYLYQGQWYAWQDKPRGTPALDLPIASFINYLQNHDQLANSAQGRRIHQLTSPGKFRAMTALMLLMPTTPLLFQGQEFAASSPFFYFADNEPQRAKDVAASRGKFLAQFPTLAAAEIQATLADPADPQTFRRSKIDRTERTGDLHAHALALHRDLLRLRRDDPVLARLTADAVHGAALSADAFFLRYFGGEDGDRLLLVNFGADLEPAVVPHPLLAPPAGSEWAMLWTSEDPRYGGTGNAYRDYRRRWHLRAETTTLLSSCGKTGER